MSQMLRTFLFLVLLFCVPALIAQTNDASKSTEDLFFLVGQWDVERIYSPGNEQERTYEGTLTCLRALDDQFIQCTYEMQRPKKTRGLDLVFFNYNSIYKHHESLWISSTWPIKGLMRMDFEKSQTGILLNSTGQFKIENDITEYVKGELLALDTAGKINSFTRQTYIRTSEDEEGVWRHHMTEKVERQN